MKKLRNIKKAEKQEIEEETHTISYLKIEKTG